MLLLLLLLLLMLLLSVGLCAFAAGWVMGPTNEVLRSFIGRTSLLGMDANDYWVQRPNPRALHSEIKKMTKAQKLELARKLLKESEFQVDDSKANTTASASASASASSGNSTATAAGQGVCGTIAMETSTAAAASPCTSQPKRDFLNPFNTAAPACRPPFTDDSGVEHRAALSADTYAALKLVARTIIATDTVHFRFALPRSTDHTGCLPGQWLRVRAQVTGNYYLDDQGNQMRTTKPSTRFVSPVTAPNDFGHLDMVLKFESHGQFSNALKSLRVGEELEFQGPLGGFEYKPNTVKTAAFIAAGGGITPCLQIIRGIVNDPQDETRIELLYAGDVPEDLLYKEEFDQYARKLGPDRFRVFYTLKDVRACATWFYFSAQHTHTHTHTHTHIHRCFCMLSFHSAARSCVYWRIYSLLSSRCPSLLRSRSVVSCVM